MRYFNNVNTKTNYGNRGMVLESDINEFLSEKKPEIIDIKFSVATSIYSEEQVYCFSAMILYEEKEKTNK